MNGLTPSRRIGLICLALALGTLALYWPAIHFDFVSYGDAESIVGNPHVQQGLTQQNLQWTFQRTDAINWHPVTWISHMAGCQVFGAHAGGHHAINLFLHIANVLLLFLLLQRLTRAPWSSAFVAALFAWHPLQVESVAWISERSNLLGTFFFLLTAWTYISYVEKPSFPRYLFTIALFALALMSEPLLIAPPIVLLLLDFWPLRRFSSAPGAETLGNPQPLLKLILEKLPFLALALACFAIAPWPQNGSVVKPAALSPTARLVDALFSYTGYLEKVFGPKDLSVLYPHPFSFPTWQIAMCALLLIAISAVALLGRRKLPFLAIGWFWFLVALIPAMWFGQANSQFMADHFAYLPLIGIFIALAWTIASLRPRFAFSLCALCAVGACLFISATQLKYWKSSTALFTHAVDVNPQNPVAHNNLADALVEQGEFEGAKTHYEQALRLKPDYVEAHYNYGNLLNARAEIDQAIVHLSTAVRLKPRVPELHNNLGNALARKGEMQKAIVEFNEALKLKPDFARAEYNLGLAYGMIEQPQESLGHYLRALQLAPADPDVQKNLANLYLKLGKLSEANDHYAAYLRLQPADIKTRCRYATVLRQAGKPEGAVEQLREVIRLQPDAVDPLADLAWILAAHPKAEIRNGTEAVRLAERATEITQDKDINCLNILAAAYAEAGRFQEAVNTSKKLREQLVTSGQKDLLAILDQRLALYQAGKPFHQEN